MNNNSQRTPLNSHLNRRAADIFSIRINVDRTLRLNPHPLGLKILDFRNVEMLATINGRK